MTLWILLAIVVVALGFVRLVPSDPARWHVAPDVTGDKNFKTGVTRLVETGSEGLLQLNRIASTSPRTKVLSGSVDSGMVTYITRTPVFGFPDYTTVEQDGNSLKIYARLRFGRSDTGVNRARIESWINALQP